MQAKLRVNHLRTYFYTAMGVAKAVDDVSFQVSPRETLGIVGESGCGKSVTALSVMRLVAQPPGKIESGEIFLGDTNLIRLSRREMRKIRGNKISMIFQDPMTSLNPVFRIGEQVSETIRLHHGLSKRESFDKAVEMLQLVGIPSPAKRAYDYPHQMSGGMRQRVMIAIALSCRPELMIADEPTTALDVTIQAQVLQLIQKLKDETGTSVILITHDMGVIAEMAQQVIVMYAGKVMECAKVGDLFKHPHHPYTESLLKSIPRPDQTPSQRRLNVIPGLVPSLLSLPRGCKFSNRCAKSLPRCLEEEPVLFGDAGHLCRCWLHE